MPFHRSEWQDRVKAVEREYECVRFAVDQLKSRVIHDPTVLNCEARPKDLSAADSKLEGTYIVRLFATFESALRSYRQARNNDSTQRTASALIDMICARKGREISDETRKGAHCVRKVRNFWAHETDEEIEPMTVALARAQLCKYLSSLWD